MPDHDTSSNPKPSARERADEKERSSGKEEGDRMEGDAQAKAEDAERDSGAGPTDA